MSTDWESLRGAAKAADREKAFDEHWPAVRAQLEEWGYPSWGITQAHRVLSQGGNVNEAVEALHTEEPELIHTTLTPEEEHEQRLHGMALQQGLRLRKSVLGDERARHFGTYGLYDRKRDVMVVGNPETGYGLSLDDVEAALTERRRR
ncbi:MAG: hypothetical protein JOZ73_09425 [Solirubrobacterales bacterium]|nr:hypothetical protein [Solirubrobacterales bacterium]